MSDDVGEQLWVAGPRHEERYPRCLPDGRDGRLLARMFSEALAGIHAEDEILRAAFRNAPPGHRKRYQTAGLDPTSGSRVDAANEGISYWLFENTLVYLIFRAWIPLAHTVWEAAYPRSPGEKLDLLVHPRINDEMAWGFEAKWWSDNSPKRERLVTADAGKLLRHTALQERFLLTFWCSPVANWASDVAGVRKTGLDPRIPGHAGATLDLAYIGAFPTHIAAKEFKTETPHYFALCVLRVNTG